MQTLVERFISKERNEPPDIDVDFEHERREEVIQYIYRKYSRERAALAATVITYRGRSAIRDVGKALGIEELQVSALARSLQWWESGVIDEQRIREAGLDPKSPKVRRWIELAESLLGFPRHLSQHVGGFVIAERPIHELVPIENAAMPERTVIQWDKDDLEELGLMKVDVLGLGMLTRDPAQLRAHRAVRRPQAHDGEGPVRRPGRLSDDPEGRHDRRLSDRVARTDGHAAAAQAEGIITTS